MACPLCKSGEFIVKDPENAYDFWEFDYTDGQIEFSDADAASEAPKISGDREIYCRRCSWHGTMDKIK